MSQWWTCRCGSWAYCGNRACRSCGAACPRWAQNVSNSNTHLAPWASEAIKAAAQLLSQGGRGTASAPDGPRRSKSTRGRSTPLGKKKRKKQSVKIDPSSAPPPTSKTPTTQPPSAPAKPAEASHGASSLGLGGGARRASPARGAAAPCRGRPTARGRQEPGRPHRGRPSPGSPLEQNLPPACGPTSRRRHPDRARSPCCCAPRGQAWLGPIARGRGDDGQAQGGPREAHGSPRGRPRRPMPKPLLPLPRTAQKVTEAKTSLRRGCPGRAGPPPGARPGPALAAFDADSLTLCLLALSELLPPEAHPCLRSPSCRFGRSSLPPMCP